MTARVRAHVERPRARPARAAGKRSQALPTSPAERVALPHRERLEARFGRPLDTIPVFSGPEVAAALQPYGAVAATHAGRIFLADPHPPLPVVAHEVVHVLQPEQPGGSGEVEGAGSPAEREAAELAGAAGAPAGATVTPAQGLRRDAVALLRMSSTEESRLPADPPPVELAAVDPAVDPAADSLAAGPAAVPPGPGPGAAAGAPAGAPAGLPAAETGPPSPTGPEAAVLPAAPAPSIDTAQAAAQQAAAAQAMAAASTPTGLLEAFAAAPPTAKARQAAAIGTDLARLATGEAAAAQSDVPEMHARLGGAEAPAEPEAVRAPAPRTVDLGVDAAGPAPVPEPAETPQLGGFQQAQDVSAAFNRLTTAEPTVVADQITESLSAVRTADSEVPRTAGPPLAVPLGGETDPALLHQAGTTATAEAGSAREDAAAAVLDGPGPDRVQPRSMDAAVPVGELPPAQIAAPPVIAPEGRDGPAAYLAMPLPPEVQASFDEQQQSAMQASVAGSVTQAQDAGTARDEAKQQAVEQAQEGTDRLNREADGRQAGAVTDARTGIQAARRDTLDRQQKEVDRVTTDADVRRRADEEAIHTRVADDQRAIDASYAGAGKDIAGKVADGDRQAVAEKAKAERDAREESWWDRAVGFVKAAFNALVEAIGAIFDTIRAAVNAILDAVKAAALKLVDAAAAFVKGAIRAFAAVLKAAVVGLIGQVFPELAAKLTRAIDAAAAAAERAVDAVAAGLKAGITALVEGLRAGIMAVINAYQSAITLAIGLASAAITGDWGELARKVLEAVLRLVGVEPATFYAFVGRAQETWQIIIDRPGEFLGHLVGAVTGGVRRFAGNFVTHLQAGVVGWLTGALGGAGIVLPERFDLMGVLDLARQILGLTWDRIRKRVAALIGEKNVDRLEAVYGFVATLVTEGWGALWTRLTEFVATARAAVFDALRSFLVEKVLFAAITKLASLFNPVGAIVQLVLTVWNLYTFLRDKLSRIAEVVVTVVNALGDIARGVLDGAIGAVEGVLARLLPLAIDLLARILNLGGLAAKVTEIVEKIRGMVDKGIDTVLQRVASAFGGGKGGEGGEGGEGDKGGAAGKDGDTVTETFMVAGEKHELRAVVTGGEVQPEMASGQFAGLIKRMNGLVKQLTGIYLDPKAPKYVGAAAAPTRRDQFAELPATAQDFVNRLATAKAPPGADEKALKKAARAERKITLEGFREMRKLVEALKLPEADVEAVHPGHGPKAGPRDSYGRGTRFQVNPLSIDSLGKGESAAGAVPGIAILPGYDRGHLVARSLGGPGDESNLVPMSKSANTKSIGIQGTENSLLWVLREMVGRPRDYGPPDNRPYVFNYAVAADYAGRTPADLQADLGSHGITPQIHGPTVGQAGRRLFALAAASSAPKNPPTDAAILAAIPAPGPDPTLADNVRRVLAYRFHAAAVLPSVEVVQEPLLWKLPVKTPGPVAPNLDVDVRWHD